MLTLPGDLTVFDIGHFGVWCEGELRSFFGFCEMRQETEKGRFYVNRLSFPRHQFAVKFNHKDEQLQVTQLPNDSA